jgi:Domain of unknown function (DUF3883)
MSQITKEDCKILGSFPKSQSNAWSEVLTENDRNIFIKTNEFLKKISNKLIEKYPYYKNLTTSNFYPKSGVRNQRPKDLWCSVVNKDSDRFINMPQYYMIASGRGLELGFSISIHPSDFSDQLVKKKLKEVIPSLFRIIPDYESKIIQDLEKSLTESSNWYFRKKARLDPKKKEFKNLKQFINDLKSPKGLKRASGSIARYFLPKDLDNNLDLEKIFLDEFIKFIPLMNLFKTNYSFAEEIIDFENDINLYQKKLFVEPKINLINFKPRSLTEPNKNNKNIDKNITFEIEKNINESQRTGRMGEDIVYKYEFNKLKDTNFKNKIIKHYEIVNDKPGWDITSYDENGKEIYIEVKSTKGKSINTFGLTINELNAAKKKKGDYFVYLVTNVSGDEYSIEKINNPAEKIEKNIIYCSPYNYLCDLRTGKTIE